MDDDAIYGKRFYQLTFKEAIAQKIISDYRILTMTVSDQTVRELVQENKLIDLAGEEIDAQTLAAGRCPAEGVRKASDNARDLVPSEHQSGKELL